MQTANLKRVRRPIFISTFSYTILALTGKVAEKMEKVREQIITGGRETSSIIWFAGRIIKYNLVKHQFWKKVWVMGMAP